MVVVVVAGSPTTLSCTCVVPRWLAMIVSCLVVWCIVENERRKLCLVHDRITKFCTISQCLRGAASPFLSFYSSSLCPIDLFDRCLFFCVCLWLLTVTTCGRDEKAVMGKSLFGGQQLLHPEEGIIATIFL